jgi:hypothetical protein
MCTASLEKDFSSLTFAKTNAASQNIYNHATTRQVVRFAMKFPLFGNNATNQNSYDRQDEYGPRDRRNNGEAPEWGDPATVRADDNGGGIRRVQSVNASRRVVGGASLSTTYAPSRTGHKTRSHSQEARSSHNSDFGQQPSQQLPIPQCKNTLLEMARDKTDHSDLRRMYDYATWNMYDRIVSARNKKRLSELENAEEMEKSSSASKQNHRPSPTVTTATASCNSSFASSPNNQANNIKGSSSGGIIKTTTSGNYNIKTTATTNKVQQQATTIAASTATTATATNNQVTQTLLHHKLRSINKAFSSNDTDSSQGGLTAATTESEYFSSASSSGCNSPATFPGFISSSSNMVMMNQDADDDHFIFQLDM